MASREVEASRNTCRLVGETYFGELSVLDCQFWLVIRLPSVVHQEKLSRRDRCWQTYLTDEASEMVLGHLGMAAISVSYELHFDPEIKNSVAEANWKELFSRAYAQRSLFLPRFSPKNAVVEEVNPLLAPPKRLLHVETVLSREVVLDVTSTGNGRSIKTESRLKLRMKEFVHLNEVLKKYPPPGTVYASMLRNH